jgi:stringent starvation protein B
MDPSDPNDQVLTSTKPYLVRAIYEWILDNGLTPHLLVDAQYPETQVPTEFVQDGQIVLNISPTAARNLVMGNERIQFGARFGGVARELSVPAEAVLGIFTRENHQGMVFPQPEYPAAALATTHTGADQDAKPYPQAPSSDEDDKPTGPGKGGPKGPPHLKVVK